VPDDDCRDRRGRTIGVRIVLILVVLGVWSYRSVTLSAQHEHPEAPGPAAPAPSSSPAPDDQAVHQTPGSDRGPVLAPVTDADRRAAFPDVEGHTVHDDVLHAFVLVDQIEWRSGTGLASWDTRGWIGHDRNRLWFRTEGDWGDDRLMASQSHLFYGRAIARWWDLVAGVRQDVRPGPGQTWAAVGVQGLAPYWFEVEATAYVGAQGRTHVRLETEYELLLTNRVVLQPHVEIEIYGKTDPERGFGTGLTTSDIGLRIRYEVRRELAPYVGVVWSRKHFGTADRAREVGEAVSSTRLAAGVRFWF
jgi:copper resistance protein B